MKRHLIPLALTCSALVAGLLILGLSFEGRLTLVIGTLVLGAARVAYAPAPIPVRVRRDR